MKTAQQINLLSETVAVINEALNAWYPNRREDGYYACDTRQRLFDMRDRLERELKEQHPLPAPAGSVEYVRVRCVICGWEDGLRADLVAAGKMGIYCDQCDGAQDSEVISPNDQALRLSSTECSETTRERQYLGKWESLSWQKVGEACYYTHRATKMELPARIVELEYEHGRGRARCEIMDVTGKLRVRWMECHELHQSPNAPGERPAREK